MEIIVNLGPRTYPIVLEKGIAASLPAKLKELFPGRSFALVTNSTLSILYGDLINRWTSMHKMVIHVMPDGERYKTIETWNGVLDTLLKARLDRSTILLAFGGGVVGDITGFAAATFLRGVDFIQIPTTLLAMVDSSVGGKTGVDHPEGKNLIGAFHQPSLVWIDTAFLDTLSEREFLAGYAELFKYGFIGGKDMFDFIRLNHHAILRKEMGPLLEGIKKGIEIKARTVEMDEKESGARALLNFGHTFAHSLEKFFGFDALLHGEAVFWGMKCAITLGKKCAAISKADFSQYDAMLEIMPLPPLPSRPDCDKLYDGMFSDKKVKNGTIRFVIPDIPGNSTLRSDISEMIVKETLLEVFD